jgi:hypothetical protein
VVDSAVVDREPTMKVLVRAREKGAAPRMQAVVEDEDTAQSYARQLADIQALLRGDKAHVYGVMELVGAFADQESDVHAALSRVRTVRGVVTKRAFRFDDQSQQLAVCVSGAAGARSRPCGHR